MSYPIASNLDIGILVESVGRKLRPMSNFHIEYSDNNGTIPVAITFVPDLSIQEQTILNQILDYVASLNNFNSLPNYATWTPQESYDNTFNAIFNGADQATINVQIDGLPNTFVGMKTGLKALASEIITIRIILATAIKMVAYIRNLVIKLR